MDKLLSKYGIAHVGYIVPDRDAAVKRLSELYEIKDWFWVEFKPFRTWVRGVEVEDFYLRIAISLPAEGTRIEVIEPVSEGVQMEVLKEGVQTINHICYIVDNYEKYRNEFIEKGNELVFEAEAEDEERGYRRCCYVYDPVLKTVVEIAEKPYFRSSRR